MPLKKNKTSLKTRKTTRASAGRDLTHKVFFPLLILTLMLWFLYRSLFSFPVWFDETIGKAVFFGLPVWVYVSVTGFRPIIDSFRLKKLYPGVLQGLAVGGIFGFLTIFIRLMQAGGTIQPALIFFADRFWWEMLLGLFTAFWETVFFFSFIMSVVQDRFINWSLIKQVVLVALVFMLFHIPNAFSRFDLITVFPILTLLTLFAVGQSLLFSQKQNGYLLVISHTIWGMVLLIYF
ncbi:hypothetical protein KKE34_03850 [Patescibacteria group bacterium]|nr:hypothetical protein [Patescibacteria group bacterium]